MRQFLILIALAVAIAGCQSGQRATSNTDLYYKKNSPDCESPKAQGEGYC
jgi:hypothetical protein